MKYLVILCIIVVLNLFIKIMIQDYIDEISDLIHISDQILVIVLTILSLLIYYYYIFKKLLKPKPQEIIISLIIRTKNSISYSFKNFHLISLIIIFTLSVIVTLLIVWPVFLFFVELTFFIVYLILFITFIILFGINKQNKESKLEKTYFNDIEITNKEDLCTNHKNYVELLKSIIKDREKQKAYYSIALNGEWGSGKTSILKSLREELKLKHHIIFVNFWKLKNSQESIIEIEKQINNFFREVFLFVPLNKRIEIKEFFKIVSGRSNDKWSLLASLSSFFTKNTFKQDEKEFKEFIKIALNYSNKEKLIIIFDDIDRIYNKEDIFQFLKTIRYIIGHENIISITGISINHLKNFIEIDTTHNNKNEENQKLEEKQKLEFLHKIFSNIIDLPLEKKQDDIVLFLKNEILDKKRLEKFLEINEFSQKDFKEIKEEIKQFIKSEKIYELFNNFREVKLSFNDFFTKLLAMKNARDNINIIEMISPRTTLLLCILKNINNQIYYKLYDDFYNKFRVNYEYDYEDTQQDDFSFFLVNFIRKNILKCNQGTQEEGKEDFKRVIKLFEIIFEEKLIGKDIKEYWKCSKEIKLTDLPNNIDILYYERLKFYFVTNLKDYEFTVK